MKNGETIKGSIQKSTDSAYFVTTKYNYDLEIQKSNLSELNFGAEYEFKPYNSLGLTYVLMELLQVWQQLWKIFDLELMLVIMILINQEFNWIYYLTYIEQDTLNPMFH